MTKSQDQNGPGANDPEITLIIQTVNGDYTDTFPKQAKIADVIARAVQHFGFGNAQRIEIVLETERTQALDPHRTLVSYGLKDGTRLILTAIVTGV
jgi:hypothetical protein